MEYPFYGNVVFYWDEDRFRGNKGEYKVIKPLGHGGSAFVFLVSDIKTGKKYTLKKYRPGADKKKTYDDAMKVYQTFGTPPKGINLINLVDFSDADVFMVLSYMDGYSVDDLISCEPKLSVEIMMIFANDILKSIGYIHSKGYYYCDFHPENVIFSKDRLVLIDLDDSLRMNAESFKFCISSVLYNFTKMLFDLRYGREMAYKDVYLEEKKDELTVLMNRMLDIETAEEFDTFISQYY